MELHEKLQELRKQKGLTQEELAEILFVSRTAISKWESGRGYPNIDSLKAISKFFSVSIDELLSGEELLTIAEADTKAKETHFRDLIFGLLDCGMALLLFLPLFGQQADGTGIFPVIPYRTCAVFTAWLFCGCAWHSTIWHYDACPAKLPSGFLAAVEASHFSAAKYHRCLSFHHQPAVLCRRIHLCILGH